MITRRRFFTGLATMVPGVAGLGGYAFAVEPLWRLAIKRYALTPPGWPRDLKLTIAAIADLHACEPFMPEARVRKIVQLANSLGADAMVLLGDYVGSYKRLGVARSLAPKVWAAALADLEAPLGIHAVLGNHDWWDDRDAQRSGRGPVIARRALEDARIPVYENDAVRLQKDGIAFWLCGLGDQLALRRSRRTAQGVARPRHQGVDDLDGTLAKVKGDEAIILLAHEPDIFPRVPDRVSLTLSGHTHGGQVRLLGYSPIVPSRFGNRYAYGHVVEGGRHLIVSGGLGCSGYPVRFGVPPEIVLVELGGAGA